MSWLERSRAALSLVALAGLIGGCADRHQIQNLASPDFNFLLIVDYVNKPFGTQDVIVSLEEKRGIATSIAVFRNIQSFTAQWLGPEDIGICQVGNVQSYRTHVTINSSRGNQDFHFHYSCPIS